MLTASSKVLSAKTKHIAPLTTMYRVGTSIYIYIIYTGLKTFTNKLITGNDPFDCLKTACDAMDAPFKHHLVNTRRTLPIFMPHITHSNVCWLNKVICNHAPVNLPTYIV